MNKGWFVTKLKENGMSQRELSDRLHLDPSAVSLFLNGKRGLQTDEAAVIAKEFNVGVETVLRQAGIVLSRSNATVKISHLVASDGSVVKAKETERVDLPPNCTGTALAIWSNTAIGTCLAPWQDTWIYFCEPGTEVTNDCLNRLCLVSQNKSMFLAVVSKGAKGSFTLTKFGDGGARMIVRNAKPDWASPILAVQMGG